ncbi:MULTISPECIES: translation elongation factor Ts [Aminobacterium]|jgi:elongation factor Ts|uniref:translation elongation factor Ts n=1 Tax=Aminobacterium TaxID=81466 RepID=UPI00257C8492|nr:translation elongation factor Ts [Aminobacterium sp. UBA4987]
MAAISASAVKELRERTGAGMMDCKHALAETKGDMEKAIDYLREKGIAKAAKKASRSAKDGRVFCYIHTNAKIASMVELNCETDFVAKTDEFQELGHELAMQVAASAPLFVSSEEVPEDVVEREKEIYRQQALVEGKPANIVDRIAEGKVQKYFETSCLLDQAYIRDGDKKINDLIIEHIAKLGENIKVGRIARFAIGE